MFIVMQVRQRCNKGARYDVMISVPLEGTKRTEIIGLGLFVDSRKGDKRTR